MYIYFLVFQQSVLNALEYRFDFFLHTFKYAVSTTLMAMVWLAVEKESGLTGFTRSEIMLYYVYAAIVYSISNFHTEYIEYDIKLGQITKLLLKPVSVFWYYFSFQSSSAVLESLVKLVVFVPILWWLQLQPHLEVWRLTLFLAYLPIIFLFAFCVFFTLSVFTFWFQDVWSIRFSVLFIMRLLSGMLVPTSLFPEWYQHLSTWLPFQYLAFTPIQLLMGKISLTHGLQGGVILIGWTIGMFCLQHWWWHYACQEYEGTGI